LELCYKANHRGGFGVCILRFFFEELERDAIEDIHQTAFGHEKMTKFRRQESLTIRVL
jgi:hypothetical protein